MASMTNQKNKNVDLHNELDLEAQENNVSIVIDKVDDKAIEEDRIGVVTDVIVIMDESGSMSSMGNEPVQSANAFIQDQKKNSIDDGSRVTLVTFNVTSKRVIDNMLIADVNELKDESYFPSGGTALNDAVCTTIDHKLESGKPDNVVLLIITDGDENSSSKFSTTDTRKRIELVQKKHDWKVLFIGANIDAFADGCNISVNSNSCAQFDQHRNGDLLFLMRTASEQVNDYRRARTEGDVDAELKAPVTSMNARKSEPIPQRVGGYRSYLQSPRHDQTPPPHLMAMPMMPLRLGRTLTGAGL